MKCHHESDLPEASLLQAENSRRQHPCCQLRTLLCKLTVLKQPSSWKRAHAVVKDNVYLIVLTDTETFMKKYKSWKEFTVYLEMDLKFLFFNGVNHPVGCQSHRQIALEQKRLTSNATMHFQKPSRLSWNPCREAACRTHQLFLRLQVRAHIWIVNFPGRGGIWAAAGSCATPTRSPGEDEGGKTEQAGDCWKYEMERHTKWEKKKKQKIRLQPPTQLTRHKLLNVEMGGW